MKLIRLGICIVLASSIFNAMAMDKIKGKELQAPDIKRQKLSTDKDRLNQAMHPTNNLSISERVNLLKQIKNPGSLDPSKNFNAAFSWATDQQRTNIMHALIQAGADVNAPNNEDSTALMTGTFFARLDVVRLLLYYGADTTLTNKVGKTVHNIAEERLDHYLNYRHSSEEPGKTCEAQPWPVQHVIHVRNVLKAMQKEEADYKAMQKKEAEQKEEADHFEIKEMLSDFEAYKNNHPEKIKALEKEAMGLPASGKLTISNNN